MAIDLVTSTVDGCESAPVMSPEASSLLMALLGDEASMPAMLEDTGGTGGDGEAVVEVISFGVGGLVLEESVAVKDTVIVGIHTNT